jgi:hypothetical protein
VKAIASGNPAVLILAEADAEMKRLTLLKKHHADEQYLARRSLRELPETIARLERRLADLAQDLATASAPMSAPFTIGNRTCSREDALERLATRLQALPSSVAETRDMPLGTCQGLRFSLVLHPQGAPDVCVEGVTTRYGTLSRDSHGPRAILNAVERVIESYEAEREKTKRDLDIAQGQQRDYQARLGAGFAHDRYLEELTGLRNQLEAALSGTEQKPEAPALPPAHELVARIKALMAANTIEPAPERTARRTATTEESVTARSRRQIKAWSEPQPEAEPAPPTSEAPVKPAASPQPAYTTLFEIPPPYASTHKGALTPQQRATRGKRPAKPQLSLF